ncbi:BZ3500_MvSof-1268-A1-R1_Chr2-1g04680 [Microbotryum saponariae]|uniref:BZ3500_MvSof-1268-A1-R1_Chr2-1g04680 protein n=1 Tax=Microbotryum saponariae TaxID=289078 RepID=A0A2X0KM76_9BASI|nr:BZ3500_MvSof-1268-A1-R1_Chr2-1g04680 [Microbotryum saponariae]SCZ92306.1 BZ3501_MvSof-1269-A2-R1_Chr2-1g04336 [Microbotryum saponariae]
MKTSMLMMVQILMSSVLSAELLIEIPLVVSFVLSFVVMTKDATVTVTAARRWQRWGSEVRWSTATGAACQTRDAKLINDIRTATGIGWDEENCRPIQNAEQWKTVSYSGWFVATRRLLILRLHQAIAKCPRGAIIEKRPSKFYYPLTLVILGKDYATDSDGFSYGDDASKTTRTPSGPKLGSWNPRAFRRKCFGKCG